MNQVSLINSQNWYLNLPFGKSSLTQYVPCPSVLIGYHLAVPSTCGGRLLLVLSGRYTHSSVAGTFSWRDVLSRMRVLQVLPRVSEVMWHRSDKCLACVGGGNRNWGAHFGTPQGTGFL
jgi:hypothetical protein